MKENIRLLSIILIAVIIITISIFLINKINKNKNDAEKTNVEIETYEYSVIAPDVIGYERKNINHYIITSEGDIYYYEDEEPIYIRNIEKSDVDTIKEELNNIEENYSSSLISYIRIGESEKENVYASAYNQVLKKYINNKRYEEEKQVEEFIDNISIEGEKDIDKIASEFANEYIENNPNSTYNVEEIRDLIIYKFVENDINKIIN